MGITYSRGRCKTNNANDLIWEQLPMFKENESMFLFVLLLQDIFNVLDIFNDLSRVSQCSENVSDWTWTRWIGLFGLCLVIWSMWKGLHFTNEKESHLLFYGLRDKVLQTSIHLVNRWNTRKDECHFLQWSFLGFKTEPVRAVFQIMRAIIPWKVASNKVAFRAIPWPNLKPKQILHMALFRILEVEHGRSS